MVGALLTVTIGCFCFGIALRFAKRKIFQDRPENSFSLFFVILYRIFFVASFLFAALTSLSCLGFIVALFVIEAIVITITTRIRMRREALLSLLTLSTEYELPLSGLLSAWQASGGISAFHPESRLVERIAQGVPLNEALKQVPNVLPGSAGVFVRASSAVGAAGPAFRAAIEQESQSFALRKIIRNCLAYATVVPLVMGFILSFVMIKIVPAFRKIFEDFGMALPRSTQLLIHVSDWSVTILPLVLLPLTLLWLFIFMVAVGGGLVARFTYFLQPGLRTLNAAALLRLLAVVVDQNQPLRPALQFLADEHPHRPMRLTLHRVLADIDHGQDWCESLKRVKLITASDTALLNSAQRLGNLPWALRQTADSITHRTMLRIEAVMQVVFPLLVIALGIVVGIITIALFIPLIKLIQSLTG